MVLPWWGGWGVEVEVEVGGVEKRSVVIEGRRQLKAAEGMGTLGRHHTSCVWKKEGECRMMC